MKVGIIGSGSVGQILAKGFHTHGHEVMIGSRDPSKLQNFAHQNHGKIHTGTFSETAKFGELIVLAVKGEAALSALEIAGRENLTEKTIIDTTNPIGDKPPVNGVIHFYTSLEHSLMEKLQEAFPAAHFVKAFSCIGGSYMVNPDFNGVKPSMFICGNQDSSKKLVTDILLSFGFEVEDMGKVEAARAIEPLCILWCIPGFLGNGWNHALKLIR